MCIEACVISTARSIRTSTCCEFISISFIPQSIKVTEDSVVLVNKVGESLLKRKVIGESPSVVRTSSLSMVLGRQAPKDVNAMKIEEQGSSFVLPSGDVFDTILKKFKFIDSQVRYILYTIPKMRSNCRINFPKGSTT